MLAQAMERLVTRGDPVQMHCSTLDGHRRRALAAGGLMALGLAGCSSTPKGGTLRAELQAAANLNPSVSLRPSPLTLRLYELKSATAFNQADFMSLFQGDQAALGADLLAREELVLQPGEKRPYNRQLNADTRFVGLFAAYRNLEQARWRLVVPVQPGKTLKLLLRADALALVAEPQ
jgi:type VI secretion system protein VasD